MNAILKTQVVENRICRGSVETFRSLTSKLSLCANDSVMEDLADKYLRQQEEIIFEASRCNINDLNDAILAFRLFALENILFKSIADRSASETLLLKAIDFLDHFQPPQK